VPPPTLPAMASTLAPGLGPPRDTVDARAGVAKALYLIDCILETGLEPFREPPTLPPIRLDEIELLCWLAISPEFSDVHYMQAGAIG